MATQIAAASNFRILKQITCPHCWEQFAPESVLWISEHNDLLGDPRLGPEELQRFLPTRFTVNGDALDAKGFACHSLACPHCHLGIPRSLLELRPLFFSIFGAPASGKSFFLAAMTWELRKMLLHDFAVSFSDSDPALNRSLNEYEESLFVSSDSNRVTPLADLIRKTEEHGDLYDTVSYGTQTVSYPRPFLFNMQPQSDHPNAAKAERLGRTVCLYDNAGEHFEPGRDTTDSPVTRHMALSRVLFFMFDPTQDTRFREACTAGHGARFPTENARMSRQDPILQEAATRIRRYTRLRQTEKHNRPLIIILSKYDSWSHMVMDHDSGEPWRKVKRGRVGNQQIETTACALDVGRIKERSQLVRKVMLKHCPEIVAAAENFAQEVLYIPVSAVGWAACVDRKTGLLSIKPSETKPYWVTVPYLYALTRSVPGLVPTLHRNRKADI